MTKAPQPYLVHIRRALVQITAYLPPDREAFLAHPMAQDAILMRPQEIGKNLVRLRHLDEAAFAAAADPSWHQVIGRRNIISHGYQEIDHAEIWQIVTDELPAFAVTIDAYAAFLGM